MKQQSGSHTTTDPTSEPIINTVSTTSEYQLSRYRYLNLFLYIIAAAVNSLPTQTFASINSLMQDRYNYSPTVITLNVLLGPIVHPFMATPGNWVLDKFGVRVGCSFGGVFLILGVWARTLMVVDSPFWALAGSILCAIGSVFLLSAPSAFALKWFPSKSVPKVIAVTVLVNLLSSGTGASIAGIILPQAATIEEIKRFFIGEAIIVTIPFILFFILFREAPKSPPSRAAANKTATKPQPYLETIKNLLHNKSYLKIIISMSFSYGIFISFVSILDESLAILDYGNPGRTTSATLSSAMLIGTISAFMFTKAIRISLKYKLIISLCLLGAAITFVLLQVCFYFKIQSFAVIAVMGGCVGFFVVPLTALFTTYSAQLTYPVGQASATGYLFAGSQTIAFVSGMIWIAILDKTNKWKVYLMFAVHSLFILVALLINLNAEENLNKTKYEFGEVSKSEAESYTDSLLSQGGEHEEVKE